MQCVAVIIQLVSRDHVCRFEHESQHGEMMVAYSAGQTVPSTAQIIAEGNNRKCVGKKRFNGSVTHGLRKEHVLRSPIFGQGKIIICFLMVMSLI
jgi:hypothetical protein